MFDKYKRKKLEEKLNRYSDELDKLQITIGECIYENYSFADIQPLFTKEIELTCKINKITNKLFKLNNIRIKKEILNSL